MGWMRAGARGGQGLATWELRQAGALGRTGGTPVLLYYWQASHSSPRARASREAGFDFGFWGLGSDADVFFDADGGFFDVGGAEGAELAGGLESGFPGGASHVAEGFQVGQGEEEDCDWSIHFWRQAMRAKFGWR